MKGCKLINCSFSITDFSYESMLKFIINETNDLTYIFADENNNKEIVTVNSSKVIYITENRKLKHVNCIKVPMKKYKVLLPLDSSGIFQGTSCATAYVTGIIARKFIDDKDIINSIKNYFEENKKNEANK